MRRCARAAILLVLMLPLLFVLARPASATTPAPSTVAPTTSAPVRAPTATAPTATAPTPVDPSAVTTPPRCRAGTVRPTAGLTMSGRVCVSYRSAHWVGSGSVRLLATRPVSGTVTFGPSYRPERPSVYVGSTPFSLAAGDSLDVPLAGEGPADASDTGATWDVWIGVPNGDRATGHEAFLSSPVGARDQSAGAPSAFTGRTPWRCTVRPATGYGLKGSVRLCVRQVRGAVQTTGTLTYTAAQATDLRIGTAFDGVRRAAETTTTVPASPRRRTTVHLPLQASQVLGPDRRASAYLSIDATPQISAPLRLH